MEGGFDLSTNLPHWNHKWPPNGEEYSIPHSTKTIGFCSQTNIFLLNVPHIIVLGSRHFHLTLKELNPSFSNLLIKSFIISIAHLMNFVPYSSFICSSDFFPTFTFSHHFHRSCEWHENYVKSHLLLHLLMKKLHDSSDLMFASKVSGCYYHRLQLVISLEFLKTSSAQVCLFCRML